MMRLGNLHMEVEALRNKTEQNRQMAKEAKAQADNATQLASSLEQVSPVFGEKLVFELLFWMILCQNIWKEANVVNCTRIFLHLFKWNQINSDVLQSFNDTDKLYRELQTKVESLGGESGDLNSINQRAKDIQKEAEYLLEKVKNGTKELESEYMKLRSVMRILLQLSMIFLQGNPSAIGWCNNTTESTTTQSKMRCRQPQCSEWIKKGSQFQLMYCMTVRRSEQCHQSGHTVSVLIFCSQCTSATSVFRSCCSSQVSIWNLSRPSRLSHSGCCYRTWYKIL